jgi:sigma-E factor negative regulatory protein RseA
MSEVNRETLSAYLDGELSPEEMRFLMRRLEHDAALRETWAGYHVGRDGLRRQVGSLASPGFADRVMAAIDAVDREIAIPPVGMRPAGKRRHWLQWSAGGAIAASVAVAALMLTQPAGHETDGATSAMTASSSATMRDATVAQVPANAPAVPQWLSASSASQFSQRAAFGASEDAPAYLPRSTPYQIQRGQPHRPRVSATSGRYLLMVRPDGYVQSVPAEAASGER